MRFMQPHEFQPFSILPVHLYGHPREMERLKALATAHRLFLMEDCLLNRD